MIKYILVFVLTLFQDNYVRLGTILGLIIGFVGLETFNNYYPNNIFTFGFIGWGIGAYFSYFLTGRTTPPRKKKFKVFQGRK